MERPINSSIVKDPKWTGRDGEYAVVVARGEPRRSDSKMREWVLYQVTRYLNEYTDQGTDLLVPVVEMIAADYIDKVGAQGVMLTREHLLGYVAVVREKSNDGVN